MRDEVDANNFECEKKSEERLKGRRKAKDMLIKADDPTKNWSLLKLYWTAENLEQSARST